MKINLLGTGYIGLPIAKSLGADYHVTASYTRSETKSRIQAEGLTAVPITLTPDGVEGDFDFLIPDILIVTIPFSRKLKDPFDYTRQLAHLVRLLSVPNNQVPWIIMTSSTSIYNPSPHPLSEDDPIIPKTDRQEALYQAEQLVVKSGLPYTILRLGGIYGPGREIGKFLLNKSHGAPLQDGPVNLIHRDAVVRAVRAVISHKATYQIVNVVEDGHPKKSDLYTRAAVALGYPAPEFLPEGGGEKIVSNNKLKLLLNGGRGQRGKGSEP